MNPSIPQPTHHPHLHSTARLLSIRPIEPQDNAAMAELICKVLQEFGCVGEGFASSDSELNDLCAAYANSNSQAPDKAYWVIAGSTEDAPGIVWGGGGFSRLKGTDPAQGICELQKLYFHPSLRGLGFGRQLIERCIAEAARMGYRQMYLESLPQMRQAIGLYEKLGFVPLDGPMGATGHHGCTLFMIRPLTQSP